MPKVARPCTPTAANQLTCAGLPLNTELYSSRLAAERHSSSAAFSAPAHKGGAEGGVGVLASDLQMHSQQPVCADLAPQLKLLTLGWLGAWQLKADGTHAQTPATLPPLFGGGSVRLPGCRSSSHACFIDALRGPAGGGQARRVRLRRAAEAARHIPLSAGLRGVLMV